MNTIDAIHFVSDEDLATVAGGRMKLIGPEPHPQNGVAGTAPHYHPAGLGLWIDVAVVVGGVLGVLFGDPG